MKQNPYSFFEKWGIKEQVPINELQHRVEKLEDRVKYLEEERISMINCLYEVENSLQAQIDKIAPPKYNLDNYSLGDK
jgi:chaperonin cofactor prefoldin